MKTLVRLLSYAMVVILAISICPTMAFADNNSQTPNITSSDFFSSNINYAISGLYKEYGVNGDLLIYGRYNDPYEVEAAQAGLEKVDFYYSGANCNPQGVDRSFGLNTYYAVQFFQAFVDLSVDGQVGPNTWRELESWTNNQH